MRTAELNHILNEHFAGAVYVATSEVAAVERGATKYVWNGPPQLYGRTVQTSVVRLTGGLSYLVEGSSSEVLAKLALAAGARSDETTQLAQSEGRQSGGSASERNAQTQSSTPDNKDKPNA